MRSRWRSCTRPARPRRRWSATCRRCARCSNAAMPSAGACPATCCAIAMASTLDNLRAALDWAARDGADGDAHVALAGASWWAWFGALSSKGSAAVRRRCHALTRRRPSGTRHACCSGTRTRAPQGVTGRDRCARTRHRAVPRARRSHGLYFGLTLLVFRLVKLGRLDDASRAVEEAGTLQSDDLPPGLLPRLLMPRAHLNAARGNYDAAVADKLATLDAFERHGDERGRSASRSATSSTSCSLGRRAGRGAPRARGRRGAAPRAAGTHDRVHRVVRQPGYGADACGRTRRGAAGGARGRCRCCSAGATTYLHLDPFALLALKLGRAEDAARALGRSRAVIGASDAREINEQRAHDDALAELQRTFAPDELRAAVRRRRRADRRRRRASSGRVNAPTATGFGMFKPRAKDSLLLATTVRSTTARRPFASSRATALGSTARRRERLFPRVSGEQTFAISHSRPVG